MKTTVNLDDDLHQLVTRIAENEKIDVDQVISGALRDYYRPQNGVPLHAPSERFPFYTFGGSRKINPDVDVNQLLADEDVENHLDLQTRLRSEAADATF